MDNLFLQLEVVPYRELLADLGQCSLEIRGEDRQNELGALLPGRENTVST